MAQKQETAFHDQRTARMTGKWGQTHAMKGLEKQTEDRTWRAATLRWGPWCYHNRSHDKSQVQSVIIIYTFDICKLSYFLKFICNTQNNTCRTFSVTHRPAEQQIFLCTFPDEVKQEDVLLVSALIL